MQKTVIINRGIPASGKSSFAKEIVSSLPQKGISATVCSTDKYFMIDGEYCFDLSKLREYHLKNQDRFKSALKDNVDVVICDNTNIEPWESNLYYHIAREFDYRVILMDFEPRDISAHIDAQSNDDYKHNIPKDILEDMKNSYFNYKELTERSSYPKSNHIKKGYDEKSKMVKETDGISELFYYDSLIKISATDYFKVKEIISNMIMKKIRDYSLDEIKLIPRHYKIIMREFHKKVDKTITAYDFEKFLDKSPKQIERYIEGLNDEFHNIIKIKQGKKTAYKLIDNFDVFIEVLCNNDLDELFYLGKKSNPKLFEKLEYQTFKAKDIYIFKNHIFEHIENKIIFDKLKKTIKEHEYIKIKFQDKIYNNIKPIRLLFTDNNWYLAYVDEDNILKLARVSFIEEVNYASNNSYQPKSIEKHLNRLNSDFQNSLTLYNTPKETAKIKATPSIAKYFKRGMKKFLSSQRFNKELEDGSIIFTLEYTQELEILPFIQKWLPDLIILEPKELKEAYINKLKSTIEYHL